MRFVASEKQRLLRVHQTAHRQIQDAAVRQFRRDQRRRLSVRKELFRRSKTGREPSQLQVRGRDTKKPGVIQLHFHGSRTDGVQSV